MHLFLNTVFCLHFCFLIVNITRGKKPPVSLLLHIYGFTDFFGSSQKMLSKEANNFDIFYVQYIETSGSVLKKNCCLIRNLS